MERELQALHSILVNPARPLVAVLGGAKVADKIAVVRRFLKIADELLIGGAMAFPFLAAQGHRIGASRCAPEDVMIARDVLARAPQGRLQVPVDLVVAAAMGVVELEPFAGGTRTVGEALANSNATTVAGGGETVAALRHLGLAEQIDHVSTGGGATLELIEGRTLPGVQALMINDRIPVLAGAASSHSPNQET